jgi:hypothetical protein
MKKVSLNVGFLVYQRAGSVSVLKIGRLVRMRVGGLVVWSTVERAGL